MNTKEYLQQIKYFDEVINKKLQEIEKLRTLATKVNVATDGERVQSSSSSGDKLGDTVANIVDLQRELNDDINRFIDLKKKVLDVVSSLDDAQMVSVLYKRYFEYLTWEQIASEMYLSRRWVTTIHLRALEQLEKKTSFKFT